MKKRVAALLMVLVMLVGLLPSAVWAEVAVTPVSTAAELAALGGQQISGSYKLTAYYDKPESEGGRIRVIIAR